METLYAHNEVLLQNMHDSRNRLKTFCVNLHSSVESSDKW